MTTAQSPVDVLRAALERLRERLFDWNSNSELHALDDIARAALAEAAALAAEVPGRLSTDSTSVGNRISAAPPPAPVPGGLTPTLGRLRMAGWSVAVHNDYRLDGAQWTFYLFTHPDGRWVKGEGRTDAEALALAWAAATPPEVVVGMGEKRHVGSDADGTPHDVLCDCSTCCAYHAATQPGRPSPSTPPVQQQGEAGAFDRALASAREAMHRGAERTVLVHEGPRTYAVPEAPTPPLGKGEPGPFPPRKGDVWQTRDGREWEFNGQRGFRGDTMEQTTCIASYFDGYGYTGRAFSPEAFTDGTLRFAGSRPPTDSQGGGR